MGQKSRQGAAAQSRDHRVNRADRMTGMRRRPLRFAAAPSNTSRALAEEYVGAHNLLLVAGDGPEVLAHICGSVVHVGLPVNRKARGRDD
jgi:hypothetical protein